MKGPTCGEETERIINICDTKIKVKVMCSCRIKEQEEKQRNTQVPDTAVDDDETRELTEFGPWKNYRQVSCNKQEIKCDIDNTNCLREVMGFSQN